MLNQYSLIVKLSKAYENAGVKPYTIQFKNLFIHMYEKITGTKLKDLEGLLLKIAIETKPKERGEIFTYKFNDNFIGIFERNYNTHITCLSIQRIINYEENQNT